MSIGDGVLVEVEDSEKHEENEKIIYKAIQYPRSEIKEINVEYSTTFKITSKSKTNGAYVITWKKEAELKWCYPKNTPSWIRYMVWQLEKGKKTDYLHYQGYIELSQPQRIIAVMKSLKIRNCRFATRKGSPGQARDYCMKEDTRIDGPWQIGRYEKHQGRPTAIHEVVDYIKSFKTPEEAMQAARRDHSYLYTYYGRNLDAIADSIARRVDVKIQDVEIIQGKSMKDVIKKEGADLITIDGGRYFLGYSGQEKICIVKSNWEELNPATRKLIEEGIVFNVRSLRGEVQFCSTKIYLV